MTREQFLKYWAGGIIAILLVLGGVGVWYWKDVSPALEDQFGQHLDPAERTHLVELIQKYKDLANKEPKNADHWLQLGFHKEKLGNVKGAIASYEKSAQLNPKAFLPFEQVGVLYEKTGQYERAERAYLAAIQNDPVKTYLYLPLVALYMNYVPQKKSLVPELLTAGLNIEGNKDDPALLEMLAVFYKNTGDVKNAISAYEKLLSVTPGNATARAELGELKNKK